MANYNPFKNHTLFDQVPAREIYIYIWFNKWFYTCKFA